MTTCCSSGNNYVSSDFSEGWVWSRCVCLGCELERSVRVQRHLKILMVVPWVARPWKFWLKRWFHDAVQLITHEDVSKSSCHEHVQWSSIPQHLKLYEACTQCSAYQAVMVGPVRFDSNPSVAVEGICSPLWETKNCIPKTKMSNPKQSFQKQLSSCTCELGVAHTINRINFKLHRNNVKSLCSLWHECQQPK